MPDLFPAGETEPRLLPRVVRIDAAHVTPADFEPLRLVLLPAGMTLSLDRPEMIIGRGSGCDVRLPLPDVSRRHCRLLFQSGRWWLLDLRSLNGVFVNDEKVQARALRPGDQLRIGGFTFLINPADSDQGQRSILGSIAAALGDEPLAA